MNGKIILTPQQIAERRAFIAQKNGTAPAKRPAGMSRKQFAIASRLARKTAVADVFGLVGVKSNADDFFEQGNRNDVSEKDYALRQTSRFTRSNK